MNGLDASCALLGCGCCAVQVGDFGSKFGSERPGAALFPYRRAAYSVACKYLSLCSSFSIPPADRASSPVALASFRKKLPQEPVHRSVVGSKSNASRTPIPEPRTTLDPSESDVPPQTGAKHAMPLHGHNHEKSAEKLQNLAKGRDDAARKAGEEKAYREAFQSKDGERLLLDAAHKAEREAELAKRRSVWAGR